MCLLLGYLPVWSVVVSDNLEAGKNKNIEEGAKGTLRLNASTHSSQGAFQRYSVDAPECSPLNADNVSFTLVTQTSVSRLWLMKYHCQRWGPTNPISIAILTNQSASVVKKQLIQLGCHPAMLAVQTLPPIDEGDSNYPINALRGMALSAVRTTHVMYIDIDLWLSANLHRVLHKRSVRETMAMDRRLALVVPAFELESLCPSPVVDCTNKNIPFMPKTKKELIDLLDDDKAHIVNYRNVGGQSSTLYVEWREQGDGVLLDIPCIKSKLYEPFLAFRFCRALPPFQVQFSGYGCDKIAWIRHLRREGYWFTQLGGAFLMHFPHRPSKSKKEWMELSPALKPYKGTPLLSALRLNATVSKRAYVETLFYQFLTWLESEVADSERVSICPNTTDVQKPLLIDPSIINVTMSI